MFAVATAAGADFVRIKVYIGAMVTPGGIETGRAFEAIRNDELAAEVLGVSRQSLYVKMRRHGLIELLGPDLDLGGQLAAMTRLTAWLTSALLSSAAPRSLLTC